MQVVILAAGKGIRMQELTRTIPKPMLEIGGEPLLAHKIRSLPSEISDVVLIVNYRKEVIIDFFGDSYARKKIQYVVQKKLNGTGPSLHAARSILHDRFMVMMGDDLYYKKDLQAIMSHELAVLGYPVDDPTRYGMLSLDKKGCLVDVLEKPGGKNERYANTGLYILSQDFFKYNLVQLPNGEYGLPQTIARMARDYDVAVVEAIQWFPIENPDDLKKAEELLPVFYG